IPFPLKNFRYFSQKDGDGTKRDPRASESSVAGRRKTGASHLPSDLPARHMIVASTVAQYVSVSPLRAKTSAVQIFSVLPDRTTRARAISSSPCAGAIRLILYSTVSTEESSGINVNAAYPHATSARLPETPA